MIGIRYWAAIGLVVGVLAGCSSDDTADQVSQDRCSPPLDRLSCENTSDEAFPVGPVIENVSTSAATVMWEGDKHDAGHVQYGLSKDNLGKQVTAKLVKGVSKARLEGLETATQYFYRVSCCGKESKVLSFRTAPPKDTSVVFTVWGDSRSDPETCGKVVSAMAKESPDFTINTGDIVADGREWEQYKEQFFDPLRALSANVPTFVAIGNHEKHGEGFFAYLDHPYPYPDRMNYFMGNYSFRWGNVFVLVVDTTQPLFGLAERTKTELSEWVEQQAASDLAQEARWRVAVGHYPAWSEAWSPGGCSKYKGTKWVETWLMPLLRDYDFHAYFAGHTHDYERAHWENLVHIISGGGGAGLDEWCRDFPQVEKYALKHHYVKVEAGCEQMVLKAIEVPGGKVIDEVVIPQR